MNASFVGTALTALTDHEPVRAVSFYEIFANRKKVNIFYLQSDCDEKKR